MATGTATQMNIRIDAPLKDAGDDALASIGLTPTRAVRALWKLAAQRGERLEEVRRLLASADGEPTAPDGPSATLRAGWDIVPDQLAALGISAQALARASRDDAALLDAARTDRAREKGWL